MQRCGALRLGKANPYAPQSGLGSAHRTASRRGKARMRLPPSDSPLPEARRSFLFGLSACACSRRRRLLRSRPVARPPVAQTEGPLRFFSPPDAAKSRSHPACALAGDRLALYACASSGGDGMRGWVFRPRLTALNSQVWGFRPRFTAESRAGEVMWPRSRFFLFLSCILLIVRLYFILVLWILLCLHKNFRI